MQTFILILTILYLTGPDTVSITTKTAEFTTLQNCMAVGQEVRDIIVKQARMEGGVHIPRVKAVCLPK